MIVRDMKGEVRAFHDMCRHRGNKLVWDDYPREETSGVCRQFTCKYQPPEGLNPARHPAWGEDSFRFFPKTIARPAS